MINRIPSLDGLRAVSIFIVVGSHALKSPGIALELRDNKFLKFFFNGELGVHIFFVISGFIITLLLLREEAGNNNKFSLSKFYLRRVIRIFPTYYIFLFFLLILSIQGVVSISTDSFIAASTFTTGLWSGGSWLLGHTWSLAVEEQFYLLWPWFLVLIKRPKKRLLLTAFLISLFPLLRVVVYVSPWRANMHYLFITQGDIILYGSLTALCFFYFRPKVESFILKYTFMIRLMGTVFIIVLFLMGVFQLCGYLYVPFSNSLTGLVISLFLLTVILKKDLFFFLLNLKSVIYIGVVSYGWYIWQQFFLRDGGFWYNYFPASVLISFLFAILNHELIEVFFTKLRQRKI